MFEIVVEHHNPKRYPEQKFYVVNVEGYAYLVPFVRKDKQIYLKTIYPSRKATKDYVNKRGRL